MATIEEPLKPGDVDFRFLQLLMSLVTAAWSQLGKIAHPVSQKVEKDLDQAKTTIDFLVMLREKTKGNLTPKESEMISNAVTDLELNFADEAKKGPASKGPELIIPAGAGKAPEIIKP